MNRVAAGGLLNVEVAHRGCARRLRKEEVLVVRLVEIRRPDGRVVDCAVGLRDLVVLRARQAAIQGVLYVGKLTEDGQDRVLFLAGELDEPVVFGLVNISAGLALGLGREPFLA